MEKRIDVKGWESFNTLERLHYEVDAYIHILDFLIDNKRTEQDTFKYYEEKYLMAHIDFVMAKKAFENCLKDELNSNTFSWEIDFDSKEAIIHD